MSDPGLEIAKEAAKAAAVELVSPASAVLADIIGGTLGDRISSWRRSKPAWEERNRRETLEVAANIIVQRKIEAPAEDARPECIEEILAAAGDTSAPSLKRLYASLIAAVIDPLRSTSYRREFVAVVRNMEPLDAAILPFLAGDVPNGRNRMDYVGERVGASRDEVECSCLNLIRLGLGSKHPVNYQMGTHEPNLTSLGRRFLAAVE